MEGIIGEKSEGFARTIIKDTWTITRGWIKTGEGGGEGWGAWRGLGGKGRKLYLNNNFKNVFKNCFPEKYINLCSHHQYSTISKIEDGYLFTHLLALYFSSVTCLFLYTCFSVELFGFSL